MKRGYEWKLSDNYLPKLNRRRAIAHMVAQLATCGFALWAGIANNLGLANLGIVLALVFMIALPGQAYSKPTTRTQSHLGLLGIILVYGVAFGLLNTFHVDNRTFLIVALIPWMAFISVLLAMTLLKPAGPSE